MLTELAIKRAKPKDKDYKLSDEKGLFLLVKKSGAKYWRVKYRFAQKEKLYSIGVYPDVSLKQARLERDEMRAKLRQGIDPSAAKQSEKLARIHAGENSFKAISIEWFKVKLGDKSKSYRDRSWRALEKNLFPALGHRPIIEITPPELLQALRKVESRGALDMAKRTKQVASLVFRYAIATGRADRDPSQDLAGALKPSTKKHFAAITEPSAVGRLMVAIDGFEGTATVKAALRLSPLVFGRPGEVRHMEWMEINWDTALWEIPSLKMKMRQPHIVPLSTQALEILREQYLLTGTDKYVFPSARGGSRPLSDNGVRTALRTMGFDNDTMSVHGFRAMARTLLDEVLGFQPDHIEAQLAHKPAGHLGAAYNRAKYLAHRTEMMQRWADYLDELRVCAYKPRLLHGG
ncbi:MAG: integrase arm-type DNA-binding domain-containing protein [Gammaproteobacteria bacterium]|nr:integrase arm-type DNA-binding domain-containing protein [Gammaproteobacteria bacterium]